MRANTMHFDAGICLLLFVAIFSVGCVTDDLDPIGGGPVLNEFMADNDGVIADEYGGFDDWVELYNPTSQAFSLNGMRITDNMGDIAQFSLLAPDSMLGPGEFCLVWCDGEPEQGPFHAPFKLSAGGESIGLISADGEIWYDQIAYDAQQTDVSQGRTPDGCDTWQTFSSPTPGLPNDTVIVDHPHPAGSLVVNELMSSNVSCCTDEFGEHADWLELYNGSAEAVRLNGLYFSDTAGNPLRFRLQFDRDSLLAPGEFLLLWCDEQMAQGATHTNFALSSNGEEVLVTAADGETLLCHVEFPALAQDHSYARITDGDPNWLENASATPGASNGGGN